jgi:hypothetical protein
VLKGLSEFVSNPQEMLEKAEISLYLGAISLIIWAVFIVIIRSMFDRPFLLAQSLVGFSLFTIFSMDLEEYKYVPLIVIGLINLCFVKSKRFRIYNLCLVAMSSWLSITRSEKEGE